MREHCGASGIGVSGAVLYCGVQCPQCGGQGRQIVSLCLIRLADVCMLRVVGVHCVLVHS